MRLLFLLAASAFALLAQNAAISSAIADLQRGDPAAAEQTLRAYLRQTPDDPQALDILGIVLDQQKKFPEADSVYRRATTLDPRSPGLLNNYANHLIATGRLKEARAVFLKVIAIEPAHPNANVQLARIALEQKSPAEALRRLDALPAETRNDPGILTLTLQVDYALHRDREGDALLARLAALPNSDARQLGTALASVGQYEKAEAQFTRALEAAPNDFELLYDLGLAASHAGHADRAREALQAALRQQPDNVEALYDLAAVDATLKRTDEALEMLVKASRLAPDRADVLEFLARTTAGAGFFADAVKAWDQYLKIRPNHDAARRERAFAITAIGRDMQSGLADLRAYVARHPGDAIGHYELGVAESASDAADALTQFNRAVALNPDLTAARIARGLLFFRQGNPAAALPDMELAEKREPANPVVLDRLGQIYMAIDRPAEALPALHRAAAASPRDSKIVLHLARALTMLGRTEEAGTEFKRFRELGPEKSAFTHPAGLVDFLSLPAEEQLARYRAGVERTVRASPDNAEAQVRWLELLVGDGRFDEAAVTARQIAGLRAAAPLLAEAADALLGADQYATAEKLLKNEEGAVSPELRLDMAIASFHVVNAQAGLEQLEHIPEAQRSGDYYLARAEMLDAAGRHDESSAALKQALAASPRRPDLYRHAALTLIRNGQIPEALRLLQRGASILPDNPDILLFEAAALGLSDRASDAERLFRTIGDRWPEWPAVWVGRALFLQLRQRFDEARPAIETFRALGARTPAAWYAEAVSALHDRRPADARSALQRANHAAPNDPAIAALSGRPDKDSLAAARPNDVMGLLFR